MKKGLLVMSLVAVVVLMFGAFSCAKPAPAPTTTSPTTAPAPAPKPTTTPAPAPAPVVTLKFAHQYAVGHVHDDDANWIASAINERTQGKVKVVVYPAQTLVKLSATFDEVSAGRVDIGMTTYGDTYGKVPLMSVEALPFLFPSARYDLVLAALTTGGVHDIMNKKLQTYDVTLVNHLCTGSMHLYSSKKPLKTLADMKGTMLRSPSGFQTDAMRLLGAVPVDIASTAEVYTAIQNGTVNGCMTSWATGFSGKLFEVNRYGTAVYFNPGINQCYMNLSILNKLPADYQKVIKDAFLERQKWNLTTMDERERKIMKDLQGKGMEIYELPADERDKWTALAKGCWDTVVNKDPENGQKVLDIFLKYAAAK